MTGRALVVCAEARHLPLPDAVADLICTSPPYLWKRKYAIDGDGEMGNEANWRLFLDNLFAATDEMLRVLKPSGSIFVNLGDTRVTSREPKWLGIPPKSRLLIPERYRVGCQDRYASQGMIVRQVQIWEKANGLPEAVTDRTRDTHEDWVQIVKCPSYYSAVDEIRTATASHYHDRPQYQRAMQLFREAGFSDAHMAAVRAVGVIDSDGGQIRSGGSWESDSGQLAWQVRQRLGSYYRELCGSNTAPLGALPGSVWTVPSEPLRLPAWLGIAHYAAFPGELVRRLVLAFSPPGICLSCGQGRWPVVDRGDAYKAHRAATGMFGNSLRHEGPGRRPPDAPPMEATILGYACACTPFTDHPGTGSPPREATVKMPGTIPRASDQNGGSKQAGDYQRVGPWREYHLDRWTPPPTRPAVVLDCFGGVGTSAMVARALGRIGISLDLSHAYSRAADWRIHHSGQHGKAISRTNLERQQVLGL